MSSKKTTKNTKATETAVEMTEFGKAIVSASTGKEFAIDGLSDKEAAFASLVQGQVSLASFARKYLIVRTSKDKSNERLGKLMEEVRAAMGSPKKGDKAWEPVNRVRAALGMAINRQFPKPKTTPAKKAETTGQDGEGGEGEGKGEGATNSKVSPEVALTQLEANLRAVMNTAFESGAGTKTDLLQFAVMTLKQWAK